MNTEPKEFSRSLVTEATATRLFVAFCIFQLILVGILANQCFSNNALHRESGLLMDSQANSYSNIS